MNLIIRGNMKSVLILIIAALVYIQIGFSQGTAGDAASFEYRFLVDMPTGGVLNKGAVGFSTDFLPDGVAIAKIEVGVFENISFGISYGGANVIGIGAAEWYKLPGVNVRVRIVNETLLLPAITLGFDSQGKGKYFSEEKRYTIKSPGFFVAGTKNFALLGYLSIHGTVNYSLENKDGDGFLNMLIGAEKTIGPSFSVMAEYDLGFNDNSVPNFGEGKGYMNWGIKWSISKGFTIGLQLRDILKNKKISSGFGDRAVSMEYVQAIF